MTRYGPDHTTNQIVCDRFLHGPFTYPFNYGYICDTISGDGDPLDAVVICNRALLPTCFVECKIIGGLIMEDEKGMDEKIFVVPINDTMYINLTELEKDEIHNNIIWFFSNYKSKEKEKWSKVHRLMNETEAINLYNQSSNDYLASLFLKNKL